MSKNNPLLKIILNHKFFNKQIKKSKLSKNNNKNLLAIYVGETKLNKIKYPYQSKEKNKEYNNLNNPQQPVKKSTQSIYDFEQEEYYMQNIR